MKDIHNRMIYEPEKEGSRLWRKIVQIYKGIDPRIRFYVISAIIAAALFWAVEKCHNYSNPIIIVDTNNEAYIAKADSIIDRLVRHMVAVQTGTVHYKFKGKDRSLTVYSFSIGKYEVTQEEWIAVLGNTKDFRVNGFKEPAYNITYKESQLFIETLNKKTGLQFRLPTEQEWEFAARGGIKSRGYEYPGSNDLEEVSIGGPGKFRVACNVGTMKPNELGLYNMAGNVGERVGGTSYFFDDYQIHSTSPRPEHLVGLRLASTINVKSEWEQRKGTIVQTKEMVEQTESKNSPILKQIESDMVLVNGNDKVPSFSISKYEVTQEQWISVMGNNPSKFIGSKLPIENISWEDCQEFIARLNAQTEKKYRLPSVQEWYYAASACYKQKAFSGSNTLDDVGWYNKNSDMRTHEVGLKKPNYLGLYDMCGNVREWCQDEDDHPKGYHYLCGGSWYDTEGMCKIGEQIRDYNDKTKKAEFKWQWTRGETGKYAADFCGMRLAQ